MNARTLTRGGAALAVAAVLAVSGCAKDGGSGTNGTGTGADPVAAQPAGDATQALAAAITKLQEQSFRTTVDMGGSGTMTGVMDPKKKLSELTAEVTAEGTKAKTEIRTVDGVTYLRMNIPGAGLPGMDGKTWRKLDGKGALGTLGNVNTAEMAKTLESATDVKWAGDRRVTGTIDLEKAGQALGQAATDISKLSTKTVPFEAGIDGDGRLASYKLTIPGVGSQPPTTMDMKFSDFGTPVDVKAPPASEISG